MADEPKQITVKVTQRGFLYWVRHPGEVITIAEHFFSKEWMELVDEAKKIEEKL